MLSLLAQTGSSLIDSDLAKLSFGIVVLIAIAYGLNILRGLRKDVASEVRMQLRDDDDAADAARMPQPLSVKAHIDFTPYTEHVELKSEFEKLRDQRRMDVHGLHVKIEQGLRETRTDIAKAVHDLAALQSTTQGQSDQLVAIRVEQASVGSRIDAMPQRIIQTLKDTKGLLS